MRKLYCFKATFGSTVNPVSKDIFVPDVAQDLV